MIIVIANVIDLLAAGIQVASGAIRQKAKILAVQILQLFMQGVSMLLLGGVTGAISNLLSCLRNYLSYKDKLNFAWKAMLIGASIAMTLLFNEQGLLGYLPAAVCTVYILLMDTKDPIKFKWLVTLCFVPWTFYHFVLQSYVGALFDIASIVSNGITLWLMIAKKNKQT